MSAKDGLQALFVSERTSVLRFFRRMTSSPALAEDLSQEAFLRVAAVDVSALSNPAAYLRRVSANLATDTIRARARNRMSGAEVADLLDVADDSPDPETRLIAKDTVDLVFQALAELPARRRDILMAARLEGVPHRRLAETYGVSTRTIEIEIRKALEHCARAVMD